MVPPVPGRKPGEPTLLGRYWTLPLRSTVPPASTLKNAPLPGKTVLLPAFRTNVPAVTFVVLLNHCLEESLNVPGMAFIRLLAEVMAPVMSSVAPDST